MRPKTPTRLAIATPQAVATEAGERAFECGGNAFDACLAAALSLAVVYPDNCALGGDLIALVRRADGRSLVVNASGPAAAGVDVEALRRDGARMPVRGAATVTVPGLVAGLRELWRCGGSLPWDDAFALPVEQAREGIPVVASLAGSIAAEAEVLRRDPGCRELFFRDGSPLREGDLLRQPALAASLERLAADGPAALYDGPIGRQLIECLRARGSALELGDLARFAPQLAAPHARAVGELEIATAPPNSQGFLLPRMLAAARELDPRFDPLGPQAGRLARAFRASLAVRQSHLAEPSAMAPERLAEILDVDLLAWRQTGTQPAPPASGDTVAIVAADDAGNSVSLLQSLFHHFGSGILDPQTGILLHNRGAHFSLDPGSPNVIAPGKRPAHTLTPCAVLRRGRPAAVIATMGGSGQPQILAEVLLRLGLGAEPGEALRAPRWVVGGPAAGDGFDRILVEAGVPAAARDSLAELGIPLEAIPDLDSRAGHAQLIVCADDGRFRAASDPRSEGSALVAEG